MSIGSSAQNGFDTDLTSPRGLVEYCLKYCCIIKQGVSGDQEVTILHCTRSSRSGNNAKYRSTGSDKSGELVCCLWVGGKFVSAVCQFCFKPPTEILFPNRKFLRPLCDQSTISTLQFTHTFQWSLYYSFLSKRDWCGGYPGDGKSGRNEFSLWSY